MFLEIVKFLICLAFIILISKYILVVILRKLAESLNLKPKTVGNIAGYATSVPELLTITISSFKGLSGASVINVLSSNIINLIQYIATVVLSKNTATLKNKAIKIDIVLVVITIIIPILLIWFKIELNLSIVPIFIILYSLFKYLDNNGNKLYLQKENKELQKLIEKEEKWERGNKKKTIKYIIYLIITGILLFFVGDILGNNLESLCNKFNISQIIIGFLLGFFTSIPELITFFESQKYYKKNRILGVVEATNNLLTSNILNLFIIQTIAILIYTII